MSVAIGTIPVTVLTGHLGAGKTTLLNHLLTARHGRRIAVIENEFGEIGIDDQLVIQAEEEIFEMNNGCICCTVRGDLIRILGNLMRRRDRFDHILVETTGMADPGPVAQTFFVDSEMREHFRLDGVVTVVDARHIALRLADSREATEQIAFADVILLNKCDLATPEELDALQERIRRMNALARIHRTTNASVDPDRILDIGGFDLQRGLQVEPSFLEPEYPFEWGGRWAPAAGEASLRLTGGADASVRLALSADGALAEAAEGAAVGWGRAAPVLAPGETLPADGAWREIALDPGVVRDIPLAVLPGAGFRLLAEHGAEEVGLTVLRGGAAKAPVEERAWAGHEHDAAVGSIAIEEPSPIDLPRFQAWLSGLLQTKGQDIYRMKGLLNVQGSDERLVFQGVHMLVDAKPDRAWDGPRGNRLVFIGRELDRATLTEGFRACLA